MKTAITTILTTLAIIAALAFAVSAFIKADREDKAYKAFLAKQGLERVYPYSKNVCARISDRRNWAAKDIFPCPVQ